MKKISIRCREGGYKIFIGENILAKLPELLPLKKYSRVAVLTDSTVAKYWLKPVKKALGSAVEIIIGPGEKFKNAGTLEKIWTELFRAGLDRKSLLVNLGGGVVGDIGGFAAGTYMRGIDFIQIPTTLLSQVDASVGGKTGIDINGIKNGIGLFNQPKAVIVDVKTLSTLPKREFVSGFAEILKHGIIADKNYFKLVSSKNPSSLSSSELSKIIERSCEIKAAVVEKDEKESGLRKILNFGHTVGHAVESESFGSPKPLLHGEAVAIGMVAESRIAVKAGLLDESSAQEIESAIILLGLPVKAGHLNLTGVLKLISSDKKNSRGKIKWVLPCGIGKACFDKELPGSVLLYALKHITR